MGFGKMGEAKKRRQAQQSGRASRLAELEKMFSERGIDFDAPGFYDHANFTRYEQADPQFLETYGEYVVHRHRTLGYEDEYVEYGGGVWIWWLKI